MYKRIPELRYCENHWKVDHLATINYPGWYSKHIMKEKAPKIEERTNMSETAGSGNSDEYMHLPQKRGQMGCQAPPSKKRQFKVPLPVKAEGSSTGISTSSSSTLEDSLSDTPPPISPVGTTEDAILPISPAPLDCLIDPPPVPPQLLDSSTKSE